MLTGGDADGGGHQKPHVQTIDKSFQTLFYLVFVLSFLEDNLEADSNIKMSTAYIYNEGKKSSSGGTAFYLKH